MTTVVVAMATILRASSGDGDRSARSYDGVNGRRSSGGGVGGSSGGSGGSDGDEGNGPHPQPLEQLSPHPLPHSLVLPQL